MRGHANISRGREEAVRAKSQNYWTKEVARGREEGVRAKSQNYWTMINRNRSNA